MDLYLMLNIYGLKMNNNRLNINFLGKELKNPVITSSGCFGFCEEYNDYFDVNELGAVNLKGITLNKRDGNSGVRIAETPSGMINCIGLENPGIEYFRDEIIKNIKYSTPIILNINGSTLEEYVKVAEIANEIDRVDFIELNISCPNVKNGGMAFGASCESAEKTTKEVKKVLTKKPLIVKLSPNVTDIVSIAKSVEYAGADSVSLVNTFLAMKIDIKTKKPLLGNIFGGLSGAAIMPIALRMVYQVYKAVNIPIVGMGGIQKYEDALEFIMAGASIVSIGSAIFSNPTLPIEIIKQINNYLEENNINNIKDLIGVAHL